MIKFTEEQKQFIYENYKGLGNKELTKLFNDKFNTDLDKQIYYFKRNHHLDSGLTGRFEKGHKSFNKGLKWTDYMTKGSQERSKKTTFKKGNIPSNHKKVGYERINVDGYIEIKVKEPNVFKLKHRVIYEQHYGKIPSDYKVIFADGNKLNLDIQNLILVSNSEELIMNRNRLRYKTAELTKTGLLIAKVIDKTNKVKKNGSL